MTFCRGRAGATEAAGERFGRPVATREKKKSHARRPSLATRRRAERRLGELMEAMRKGRAHYGKPVDLD